MRKSDGVHVDDSRQPWHLQEDLENTCDWSLSVMTKVMSCRFNCEIMTASAITVTCFVKRTNALLLCNIIIVFHKGAVYSNSSFTLLETDSGSDSDCDSCLVQK